MHLSSEEFTYRIETEEKEKEKVRAVYTAIEESGNDIIDHEEPDFSLYEIGPEQNRNWTLRELKLISLAVVLYADAHTGLEGIPKVRYDGDKPVVTLNGSARHDHTPLGNLVRKTGREGSKEVYQEIWNIKSVSDLVKLMSPNDHCAWDFRHVIDEHHGRGTIVYRLLPVCRNVDALIRGLKHAVGFIRGAMSRHWHFDPQRNTTQDLKQFVSLGLREVANDRLTTKGAEGTARPSTSV